MIAKKIADTLGYELQIVKLDWDALIPAVQSGTVDCVIAGQSITSERLQSVDFTKPYYYASVVGLAKKGSDAAAAASILTVLHAHHRSTLSGIRYSTRSLT